MLSSLALPQTSSQFIGGGGFGAGLTLGYTMNGRIAKAKKAAKSFDVAVFAILIGERYGTAGSRMGAGLQLLS
jgi:hypothetical protein